MSAFQIERGQSGAEVDVRSYNLLLGGCLFYGFALNYLLVRFFSGAFASMNPLLFIIAYFVLCLGGSVICNRAETFGAAFLGYNMIVVPIGGLLACLLPYYSESVISTAFLGTALVAGLMIVFAAIRPEAFRGLGRTLFIALAVSVVVDLVLTLFGVFSTAMDWIITLIFAGYVGFDWTRANECYPSSVNAVRSACALYMDIINIFVRLLSIISRNRRN